jgi:hypothetical protein
LQSRPLAYAGTVVFDPDTDIVVAATVHTGKAPDAQTIIDIATDAAVTTE